MQQNRVAIAIIGAGTIAQTHAAVIEKSPDAILSAIVDTNDAGKNLAEKYHAKFFGSIEDMLKWQSQLSIDAAIVWSIGTVIGVSGVWASLKPPEYFQGNGEWRGGLDGGVILINLIHEVDLLQYLLGSIQRVYAEKAPSIRNHEAEEGLAATFRFQSGVVGTFLALDNAASPFNIEAGTGENQELYPFSGQDCYRIFGTRGTLSIPDNKLWSYAEPEKGRNSKMQNRALDCEVGDVYEDQLRNFIEVVRGTEDPVCSGEAGLSAVAVCEAIKESLRTNQPVDVPGGYT
ncbi:Hypothetical protein PENO1_072190 [Penicillium occitanis (nom. inval.)]|nr:Hypothetical protein PENO1_072190 [Penicillium occitanis (nom. inval.)]PCG95904.1 hypothetical protein PENOC_075480 [Penicillium occitanis (nom. inval.)]